MILNITIYLYDILLSRYKPLLLEFMFVIILLSLLTIPIVYLLPFLATLLSKDSADKWAAYWLLLLASDWTVIPMLGLYFEEEALMIFKLVIALALMFLLNREKVNMV